MKKRKSRVIFFVTLIYISFFVRLINTEDLRITTYYPSPYGAYVSILATDNTYLARNSGSVFVGTSGAAFTRDQGGSLELGAGNSSPGSGTPYIDFHYRGITEDYNVRLINNANRMLSVEGNFNINGNFYINGSFVCVRRLYIPRTDNRPTICDSGYQLTGFLPDDSSYVDFAAVQCLNQSCTSTTPTRFRFSIMTRGYLICCRLLP